MPTAIPATNPAQTKSAVASGLKAQQFRLMDSSQREERVFYRSRPDGQHAPGGIPGDGLFRSSDKAARTSWKPATAHTCPFASIPDVWRETILKAINFLYAERCGMAIPGVHGVCHRDWTVVHGDQRIVINGGWHDAGDLTQGLGNTAEIVYGLFSLAERLRARDEDPALYERLVEEARWGLDWVLKTSFGDGYRNQGSVNSRWTDGIIGNSDDITSTARNSSSGEFRGFGRGSHRRSRVLRNPIRDWRLFALRWQRTTGTSPVPGCPQHEPAVKGTMAWNVRLGQCGA